MQPIKLDKYQAKAFKEIQTHLFSPRKFFDFLRDKKTGLYLYGEVGSGKTYLLKYLFDQLDKKKLFIHYHNFLILVQDKLNEIGNETNKIEKLCKFLSDNYDHIFIDELEILDITDAMLLKLIVPLLSKQNVRIYFSTNIRVKELYKDGIQRDSFLSLIKFLEKNFLIYELNNEFDYREEIGVAERKRYLYPNSEKNNNILEKLFHYHTLPQEEILSKGSITVNKHDFNFIFKTDSMIFFDFKDLFEANSSNRDFEKITKQFDLIFIRNIREIKNDENNIIKRFINFIDLLYIHKKKLILTSEIDPKEIYKGKTYINEFKRTKSRLNEIESFK